MMNRHLFTTTVALVLLGQTSAALAATEIYDTRGRLITTIRGKEQFAYTPLSQIPQVTRMAVVAIEDSRFYEHHGIDLKGMARALWTDIRTHRKAAGGSTITQQLIKNKYLNKQKSLERKIDEAVLALEMEQKYSKDQILEMYLNEVEWGYGAKGIEAAAQTYFGHSCRTLNLAESAVIAAMLRAPAHYDPYKHYQTAIQRQHVVLDRMAELGIISKTDAEAAKRQPLNLPGAPGDIAHAQYFTHYVVGLLSEKYGRDNVLHGNFKVQTTLDLATQEAAERYVKQLVARYGRRYRFDQAALVALNPHTGGILAMVGGRDFRTSPYNRAVLAHRQPGSTFKPFVYLTAFSHGVSPTATMSDQVVTYMVNGHAYAPHNYQGEREGTMTLRRALELSNNVVTIKLLNQIGPESVVDTARRIGLKSPLKPTLALGLGAYEVTPLELASAYGVFAANGVRNEPIAYWNVRDGYGRLLEEHHPNPQRVYDEAPIRLLTNVLEGVIRQGTGTAAKIGRPVAGKTGTTSDSHDAWFVGYTPQLVVAIWTGNDSNRPMTRSAAGGVVVAPTWGRFVSEVLKPVPVATFLPPIPIARPVATGSARPKPPGPATASPHVPATPSISQDEPLPLEPAATP
jgi:1A family penicillin-binding protein